jgi:hypothetical protein
VSVELQINCEKKRHKNDSDCPEFCSILLTTKPAENLPTFGIRHSTNRLVSVYQMLPSDEYVRVSASMGVMLGGRPVVKKTELTNEMMFSYLIANGMVSVCADAEVLHVTVERLGSDGGVPIRVEVAKKGGSSRTVAAVKELVSAQTGIVQERMQLCYKHAEDCETASDVGSELDDDAVLRASCTLLLMVGELRFTWNPNQKLFFANHGWITNELDYEPEDDAAVYTQISPKKVERCGHEIEEYHGLVAIPAMEPRGGIFTLSLRVSNPQQTLFCDPGTSIGVVSVDTVQYLYKTTPVQDEHARDSDLMRSWFFSTTHGELNGHHENGTPFVRAPRTGHVPLHPAVVITAQLDSDRGTLRFWVNGKIVGKHTVAAAAAVKDGERLVPPHFAGLPKIPMQWAVVAPEGDTSMEIVDDHPVLEPFDGCLNV